MCQMVCVLQLNEESREDQERTDEEVAKDAAVFDAEDWPAEQSKPLGNEADEQVDEEEAKEAKDFERLIRHEVRDKNVNDGAEHLNWDVRQG